MTRRIYSLLKDIGVSERRLAHVMPRVKMQIVEEGQVIIAKGEEANAWNYTVNGLISASAPTADKGLVPINLHGARSWFGEGMILHRQASALEYVCLARAIVLSVPTLDVMELYHDEPVFCRYFACLIAWRALQQSEMLVLMKTGNPQLRVVMGLALLAEALRSDKAPALTECPDHAVAIPLKQAVLACIFAVSRGVFSECVQRLVAAGWVSVEYASLHLMSAQTWGQFSHTYRQARLNLCKPSMNELLELIFDASVSKPSPANRP